MSSSEQTVARAARLPRPFSIRQVSVLRRLLLLALGAWSVYWAMSALEMVRAYTRIGAGAAGPSIDGHEIFELVFVASHCMVRWAPPAIALGLLWLWARRSAGRARTG